MGYEVHFKGMSNEIMDKYNKKNKGIYGFSSANEYKLSLKVYTLLAPDVSDGGVNRVPDVKNTAFNIRLYLGGFETGINQAEDQYAYDRWKEDGKLWYCGYEYSHDYRNHTREEIYDYVVERLTILKFCAETGDYFDSESHFDEKVRDIDDALAYFEDMIRDIKIYEIMNDLKDYRIPDDYDEDDEYDYNKEDEEKIGNPIDNENNEII